jgi:hypothetical protein
LFVNGNFPWATQTEERTVYSSATSDGSSRTMEDRVFHRRNSRGDDGVDEDNNKNRPTAHLECEGEGGMSTDNHWRNWKLIWIISKAFRRHPW